MSFAFEQLETTSISGYLAQDPIEMANKVIKACEASGATIGCAESLTGGLLADAFVRVPGASAVFRGSAVTYATELKHGLLGVDGALLDSKGAVDPQVAHQMAVGARRLLGVELAISATGVAGPSPQDGQRVGTVFLGLSTGNIEQVFGLDLNNVSMLQFDGGVPGAAHTTEQHAAKGSQRELIRHATVQVALGIVQKYMATIR